MFVAESLDDLRCLHAVIMAARFPYRTQVDDKDMALSAGVAKIANRVCDEWERAIEQDGNEAELSRFRKWRTLTRQHAACWNIKNTLETVVADGQWLSMSHEEKMSIIDGVSAPFCVSPKLKEELILLLEGGPACESLAESWNV